jgi:hypothetical protein
LLGAVLSSAGEIKPRFNIYSSEGTVFSRSRLSAGRLFQ